MYLWKSQWDIGEWWITQIVTLNVSLEQIKVKKSTVEELDTKIYEAKQDPDTLETEILEAEDI